jgi:hypothetical protein
MRAYVFATAALNSFIAGSGTLRVVPQDRQTQMATSACLVAECIVPD